MWLPSLTNLRGEPLIEEVEATIIRFIDSRRYLPAEGELQDRGLQRYWWIINNHSFLLRIIPPDTDILGVIDGEVRGREGIEYYLEKLGV